MSLLLPELLCPAGDEAALRAAVDSGANAVYLGYRVFGARASAVNFDAEALEAAVRYAHLYHVRVYVTVNTLVKPGEMQDLHAALGEIAATGADAAIVQDLGVAAMVRREFPALALHASTQMAICNAEGARLARSLGFSRVVLARECSLEDAHAVAETGIETEVFTPFVCGAFTELFSKDRAVRALKEGKAVFFAGGTGHPYFSTDTTTVLRAIEIEAEVILLAKSIDGVYDSDPKENPSAKKYDTVSIQEVIDRKLGVVDMTASILCMENRMPMLVFGLNEPDSIINSVGGQFTGTRVTV